MRSINPTLTNALVRGVGTPYIKGYIGYANGFVTHSDTVTRYKLTGTALEFELPYTGDLVSDQECIWLERGLTVAGTTYTVTTGRFRIQSQHYLPNGHQIATGSLFPRQYYSAPGDDTYQNVITAFCAAFGKTAVFRNPADAWLGYQFFPAGKSIVLNDANRFANLLAQKYLIFLCDNGNEEVLVYSCAGSLDSPDLSFSPVNDFFRDRSTRTARCLIWRDENEAVHTAGSATDPLHNLGFLPSTADAPARRSAPYLFEARMRPDLRVMDGDAVRITSFGNNSTGFALVTEEYTARDASHSAPRWATIITSNEVFSNTEGGALPSTIERVSNYTPLNTGTFNRFLSSSDNNLQAAMDTIDDHALASYSAIWGSNGLKQTVAAGATNYIAPFVDGLQADSGIAVNFPRSATVRNCYLRIATAQPASGSLVVTVVVGGSATSIVVTIPAGSPAGVYSDTVNTAALNAGQAINFRIKNNATAVSAQVNGITVELAGLG